MTARLLPSPNALHIARPPSALELAAHAVIDELFGVVDRLQQQADAYTVEDVDEACVRLNHRLLAFYALAAALRADKANNDEQAIRYLAILALAGA